MRILRKFLKLTKRTYPHGTETLLENHLPQDYLKDNHGNYFLQIGDEPTTMFTCHLDTASHDVRKVNHVFDGNLVKTDGTSILGADDKAGMVVLLYMIEQKVPGLYYFFLGEERGCIGSGLAAKDFKQIFPYIKKVISFDRRGTTSVITHQMSGRSCSDEFAQELSNRLNAVESTFKFRPDSTGVYTDSAEFVEIVEECTNISVGYQNEHTTSELQDINHLTKLCKAVAQIDFESLPVSREAGEDDWGYPNYGSFGSVDYGYGMDGDIYGDDDWNSDDYSYLEENHTWVNYDGNGSKKVFIAQSRINYEKEQIHKMLKTQGYAPSRILWDGSTCYIQECSDGLLYVGSRSELVEFVPELEEIPSSYLKYELPKKYTDSIL